MLHQQWFVYLLLIWRHYANRVSRHPHCPHLSRNLSLLMQVIGLTPFQKLHYPTQHGHILWEHSLLEKEKVKSSMCRNFKILTIKFCARSYISNSQVTFISKIYNFFLERWRTKKGLKYFFLYDFWALCHVCSFGCRITEI